MDSNKILDDQNLSSLGFIKEIDIFSIVDVEVDKQRKKENMIKKLLILFIVSIILITSIGLFLILQSQGILEIVISEMFNINNKLIWLLGGYIIMTWTVMLLLIPCIKRKRV